MRFAWNLRIFVFLAFRRIIIHPFPEKAVIRTDNGACHQNVRTTAIQDSIFEVGISHHGVVCSPRSFDDGRSQRLTTTARVLTRVLNSTNYDIVLRSCLEHSNDYLDRTSFHLPGTFLLQTTLNDRQIEVMIFYLSSDGASCDCGVLFASKSKLLFSTR